MKHTLRHALAALLLTSIPAASQDSAPKLINYQGRLAQPNGQPLADGAYKLRFTVHSTRDSAQAGDALIWGSDYTVTVVNGQFNVVLGAPGGTAVAGAAVNQIGFAFTSPERFLQLEILDQAGASQTPPQIILPRQQFLSTPYALNGVPTGTAVPFAGSSAPEGWSLCNGQSLDGNDPRFKGLFQAVGLTYGGSGTSFNVPDLRGRTPIGAGQGTGLSNRSLAQRLGAETHTLSVFEMPAHGHTGRTNHDGDHSHTTSGNAADDDGGSADTHFALGDSNAGRNWIGIGIGGGAHSHAFTTDGAGGNGAHNIMQPSLVLNYIIKL